VGATYSPATGARSSSSDNDDEDEEDSDEEPEPEPEPVEPAATMAHSAWGRRIVALAAAEAELGPDNLSED
jgi:hypothetical protein